MKTEFSKKFVIFKNSSHNELWIGIGTIDTFHAEIIKDKTLIISGGFLKWNSENKEVLFYGKSEEFGKYDSEMLKQALENNGWMIFFFINEEEWKFIFE